MRYLVCSVPERKHWLPEMQEQISHLEVVDDYSRNGTDTMLFSFLVGGADAAVHLEDDALLTSDFCAKVERVIAERPHQIINFFSRHGDDATRGSRELPGRNFWYTVCFYTPPGYAPQIAAYYQRWPRRNGKRTSGQQDLLVADWLVERRERFWLHVPSLVQHRLGPSLVGHTPDRQSASFVP